MCVKSDPTQNGVNEGTKMQIKNMKIEEGLQNWVVDNMTSGDIGIELPNGTVINIRSAALTDGDWTSAEITIHRLKDTKITVHEKGSSITKKQRSRKGHTWTVIKSKGDE